MSRRGGELESKELPLQLEDPTGHGQGLNAHHPPQERTNCSSDPSHPGLAEPIFSCLGLSPLLDYGGCSPGWLSRKQPRASASLTWSDREEQDVGLHTAQCAGADIYPCPRQPFQQPPGLPALCSPSRDDLTPASQSQSPEAVE